METGLLWFFLFLALAIGWGLGFLTRSNHTRTEEPVFHQPQDIKHRLQLFFDSYNDQSIDQFVQSLEVTHDTVGLHISIGKHFRTQGEVEKAILIHQNLMAHPELDRSSSEPVIYELAKDYKAAGLFDRAESLLGQLKNSKAFSLKSHTLLLEIYEREKDWSEALDTAMGVDLKKHPDIALKAAHYCCEIAEEELRESNLLNARKYLKRALGLSKKCVRAHLDMAEIEADQENYRLAISHLKQVAENSPENIALTLPLLFRCTIATKSFEQYRVYLNNQYASTGQVGILLALIEFYIYQKETDKALSILRDELAKGPSLTVLHALLSKGGGSLTTLSDELLKMIKMVVDKIHSDQDEFKCGQCGFGGNQLHWMCPSCKSWQSITPAIDYIKQD